MVSVFHSSVNDIVPWQATYAFPSQATAVQKQTVKLQPKESSTYGPSNLMRIDFPSDGYLNLQNTMLTFDFTPSATGSDGNTIAPQTNVAVTSDGVNTEKPKVTLTSQASGYWNNADYFRGWYLELTNHPAYAGQLFLVTNSTAAASVVTLTLAVGTQLWTTFPLVAGSPKVNLYPGLYLQKGGAHQLIERVRILYGGLVLEDIVDYHIISRMIQTCGLSMPYCGSVGTILDGSDQVESEHIYDLIDQDQAAVVLTPSERQIIETSTVLRGAVNGNAGETNFTNITGRRFALRLHSGLMQSKKLMPLKWMAAQFQLEIRWNKALSCMLCQVSGALPSYSISNVNLIAELHEFDTTYDSAFVMGGLAGPGVPIKFTSWHQYGNNITGSGQMQYNISERARSIKYALAVVMDQQSKYQIDSCYFYNNLGLYYQEESGKEGKGGLAQMNASSSDAPVENYQFRIGGYYYPAQPVDCLNYGVEPYMELLKVLNACGAYTFSNQITSREWTTADGPQGGRKFIMAAKFENSDVNPDTISGINGENQQSIQFIMKNAGTVPQDAAKRVVIYVGYDALMIVRQNNVVDLVQ